MTVSAEEFKQGMRRLGGAVNIVTASHEGTWSGLTATAVTSLSAEPPRLLACVNRQGATYDIISRGRTLGVNVLGTQHKDLAMRFAGMDDEPETGRFNGSRWHAGLSGAPLLDDALVCFDCEVENIMDVGSHGIVIGNVRNVEIPNQGGFSPLFYGDGKWASLNFLE